MNNKALIIFVRNPEPGKVKTRLAATIGNEKALEVYVELLQHTHEITAATNADKFVFYADSVEQHDMWDGAGFTKKLQASDDLGGKMKAAFTFLFEKGYEMAIIIGSDCFDLSTEIIEESFKILEQKEVVIGPATDGGYYLLGMKKVLPRIFENKQWSTEHVFQQTIRDLQEQNVLYSKLITLTDVDTEADWIKTRRQ